jgi:hypothetical protein
MRPATTTSGVSTRLIRKGTVVRSVRSSDDGSCEYILDLFPETSDTAAREDSGDAAEGSARSYESNLARFGWANDVGMLAAD